MANGVTVVGFWAGNRLKTVKCSTDSSVRGVQNLIANISLYNC